MLQVRQGLNLPGELKMPQAMRSVLHYPLTELLGKRASVMILRALHRHGAEMSATTLGRHTGLSKRSVRLTVLNLEQQMAIESLGTGRSVLFRIRRDHPFANDLATLFEAEESRFQAIIATVGQIADADIEILALWFYGSAAREEDSPASDVDFTLAVRRGAAPQAQAQFRERIAFIESLYAFDASVIAIDEDDIVRLAGESDPWWNTLVRDAIVLRGSRPEDMARRLSQAANNS